MRDNLLISAMETTADCIFKDFINSEKPIMFLSQDKELVNYLTVKETRRLRLKAKNKLKVTS